MKPVFSEEEKIQAVRIFLIALRHKKAKITNYWDIAFRLNSGRVKPLCELKKSGQETRYNRIYEKMENVGDPSYTSDDGHIYFEWLVSVVSGTLPDVIDDALVKRANDQLFDFIQVFQQSGNIEMDSSVQMIEPYDWQKLFSSFDERLTNMQKIIDKGDKDIIEVLKPLLQLMKENKTLLKKLSKDIENPYGR